MAYIWNVSLSEALLQGLSALEIGLRNSIHSTFTSHVGTEYWFHAVLMPDEMRSVTDVWNKLSKRHKHPPSPGKIIAELTFGFWPFLFDTGYHNLWWENHTALFRAVFPALPAGLPPHQAIVPKTVHTRVGHCHMLRNRVMHHEPIFAGLPLLNLPSISLPEIHGYITDMLSWIDPTLAQTLAFADRFSDIHQNEQARIRTTIKNHFRIT